MKRTLWRCAAAAVLVLCGLPAVGRAALAGKPGNSGTLNANKIIAKQQLICDPESPDSGSTSVTYDPTKSSLSNLEYGPGYEPLFDQAGFILVKQALTAPAQLIPIENYLVSQTSYIEAGYVQIRYEVNAALGTPGQQQPDPGYVPIDRDAGVTGTQGVDTFSLFFNPPNGVAATVIATYKIFGAGQNFNGFGNQADFIQSAASGTVTATNDSTNPIGSATVSGNYLPEPSAVTLVGLAGLGLLARRRH